jgi:hypothetical protein
VTTPVFDIVAIPTAEETQGLVSAGVLLADNVVVLATQTTGVPDITGSVFTVTVSVSWQPFTSVYVIMVVPVANPVTTPVFEMVAIAGFEELQGAATAGVVVADKVVVLPIQTDAVPEITGDAFIVTVCVSWQPLTSV